MSSNEDIVGDGLGVLALTISYVGTAFAGSQRQGARRTVQGELERALAEFWKATVSTVFAGRTDQGVHAAGQVVSTADQRSDLVDRQIVNALNRLLPEDLSIVRAERRPSGFHARYDARWREYRYRVWTGPRQPLAAQLVSRSRGSLDLVSMRDAAMRLVGSHDFASFAGDGEGVPWSERQGARHGTIRTVSHCSVTEIAPWWCGTEAGGRLYEVRVVADGFLPKMVRNLVGVLTEIGGSKREPDWVDVLIAGRDRRLAGMTAPANGLILWRIGYAGDAPEDDRPQPAMGGV